MITPTRVLFEEGQRTAEVTLVNRSSEVKTYRIELTNKIQNENGGYIDISPNASFPGKSAMEFIRFSPRVVTIQPGKYQKIRVHARVPGVTASGEYRVHLAMRSISSKNGKKNQEVTTEGKQAIILPRMSFSIPILVRRGASNIETKVTGVDLIAARNTKSKPNLDVQVSRTGNASSYGTLTAYMKLPNSVQVQTIGKLSNVTVYPELGSRHVKVPLWVDSIPSGAIVQVVYEGEEEYAGRTLGVAAFKYSQ